MPAHADDRVLIDYRTSDDAGVYRWEGGPALVQTVDFFTPIVDDPHIYGQIAAANSLSDVYAMGGTPLTALAIAGFPRSVDRQTIREIFRGGTTKLREAGVALLGGHTVQDVEIKFGYSVTGSVDPARVLSNAGARPGDELLLTKALGTGIIATAIKYERAPERAVDAAVGSMLTLNRAAAEALGRVRHHLSACTDITGFGLLGHATALAHASNVTLRIVSSAVPLLEGVMPLVRKNITGGGKTNEEHFGPHISMAPQVPADLVAVLFDPQTSGGLLVSVARAGVEEVVSALSGAGVDAARIGQVGERDEAAIVVS